MRQRKFAGKIGWVGLFIVRFNVYILWTLCDVGLRDGKSLLSPFGIVI
jgi:hypothetical protein